MTKVVGATQTGPNRIGSFLLRLMPKRLNSLTVRTKVLALLGTLLLVTLASNLTMRSEIANSESAIVSQATTLDKLATVQGAIKAFGDLKYWSADLANSLSENSEKMADQAAMRLREHLVAMQSFEPANANDIESHVSAIAALSLEALDEYIMEERDAGNKLMDKARVHVTAVDQALVEIDKSVRDRTATAGQNVLERIGTILTLSSITIAFSVFFTAAVALIISSAVIQPIKNITEAMMRLAKGDNAVVIPSAEKRDEIGDMARTVQVFKETAIEKEQLEADAKRAEQEQRERDRAESEARKAEIESREERARRISEMVVGFDGKVTEILGRLNSSSARMRDVSGTMVETARRTSDQSKAVVRATAESSLLVESLAAATEEMTGSIAEISRQAQLSNEVTLRAVNEGKNTTRIVRVLSESAARIDDVIGLISEIAEQTNLLALNATIEAAHAGEAGKGFAVVASEVKNLANQTAKATSEIGSQIKGMQSAISQTVEAMSKIDKVIDEIDHIATTISAAVEEQAVTTNEIADNIHRVSNTSGDISVKIASVADNTDQTGSAAEEVGAAASDLTHIATDIQSEIEAFLDQVKVT